MSTSRVNVNPSIPQAPPRELRSQQRKPANTSVEIVWKTEDGERRFEQCRTIDISDTGVAIECPEELPLSANVVIRAADFHVAALAQVRHTSWRRTIYVLGLHFIAKTSTHANDPMAPDHYEILRLGSQADHETIDRVYRTLMKRYHPDNEKTGDAEIFLRIVEAHRILTDPKQRRQYDAERDSNKSVVRFDLHSRDFFRGLKGEQNRRLAVLCLLYRKRASDHELAGLNILDLELMSGFTREELGFGLWYLCEKGFSRVGDNTSYVITAAGVDHLEARLADDHPDLRTIAMLQLPAPSEGPIHMPGDIHPDFADLNQAIQMGPVTM